MRPEANSRRLFGITRSKGKMYEFGLPEEDHIAIPEGSVPEQLLLLAVGTLGDIASELCEVELNDIGLNDNATADLHFASSFFDALLESHLSPALNRELFLLASAAYYLVERPGSSLVMAKAIGNDGDNSPLKRTLHWLLGLSWSEYPIEHGGVFGAQLDQLAKSFATYFYDGSGLDEVIRTAQEMRRNVYRLGDASELLQADLICSVVNRRIASSSWMNLPRFSALAREAWLPIIQREAFPKELWPAQMLLGKAGLFAGLSGLVQMPTSAGKTRSVEMIIRSAFMSGRVSIAVIIAPFRALCHEINQSLREAFSGENVKVDELSDALQPDYLDQFAELFGVELQHSPSVIVLTPEKLLYVLRQSPNALDYLGLVVYDEGHQFDTGQRGITYELLLTEIKQLLPDGAQTVLISAVIQNAEVIANWLLGEGAQVISGSGLLPTARSVAFASWTERLGQLMFYESEINQRPDYFVPRIIESQKLKLFGKESKERYFPERDNHADVSLYLALRMVPNGAAAVFCGRKDTAQSIVSRSVEIFDRGLGIPAPVVFSNPEEVKRLKNLYSLHFGDTSESTRAAELGIYAHHGNTPHGLRLALEYAIQQGHIVFIACTSTLAQGVNMPIRYLIVSGVHQGRDRIKVRDFHNLMGRAGRAGMHTEGLVIFSDPQVYDGRLTYDERWRFDAAKELLDPDNAEPTLSSLLDIVKPLIIPRGLTLPLDSETIVNLLLRDESDLQSVVQQLITSYPRHRIDEKLLTGELIRRRALVTSIESFLMAHRGEAPYEQFSEKVTELVQRTLAYSTADETQKSALRGLFSSVAAYVNGQEPDPVRQAHYAKTLLGVDVARKIEAWTIDNRDELVLVETHDQFLDIMWEVLAIHMPGTFASSVQPEFLPQKIAQMWMSGASYEQLFSFVSEVDGTKPWGKKRRRLNQQDVMKFCEGDLGFNFPLGIAAITEFLFGHGVAPNGPAGPIMRFQKALKYGIRDNLAISAYEAGLADRMLAQEAIHVLRANGFEGTWFDAAMPSYQAIVLDLLNNYPSYFSSVVNARYAMS